MNQEKTLEEKLRELSLDDLNKITYQKIVVSASIKDTMQRPDVKAKYAETRAKIGKAHKGKVISDETRAKISLGNKGKVKSDEHKAKISAANTGKKWSDNIRAKKCKLTEAQVLEIRSKYIPHKYTSVMLGKEYGLQAQAVMRIINRISWNHI
jgi:acyl-CoA synthetase (NDP forming)